MTVNELRKRIEVALGKRNADLVIKNCRVFNVFTGEIREGEIACADGVIAAIGEKNQFSGQKEIDAEFAIAIPGLIDSHIHIESSMVSPEEFVRMAVPCGTTTVIADPHEITNVCGLNGLYYMHEAASNGALDVKFMIPSCVPATLFENSGAELSSKIIEQIIRNPENHGLAELMNYVGVVNGDEECLKKLCAAINAGKNIDGHSPGLLGIERQAYISTGIRTDHECSTVQEMEESIRNGMYVQIRHGSACHNLEDLIPGITAENSRRCILCSDDRQPVTFMKEGHIDWHLRTLVSHGIDALSALRMATLNPAECYNLHDRGAIAPGLRADIVLVSNLEDFEVQKVFINGELVSENKKYLKEMKKASTKSVIGSVVLNDFSKEKLRLNLASSKVKCIGISKGSIVTEKRILEIDLDKNGNFLFNPKIDVAKIAVIERHRNTGNVGIGLIHNYGIKNGAIAITIAHDSHNIISVGTDDVQMETAVKEIARIHGGIVLVKNNQIIGEMSLPIAGLMSEKDGNYVAENLSKLHEMAVSEMGINPEIDPIMTLCFMALPVIPELKITDQGLFDVTEFKFTKIESD